MKAKYTVYSLTSQNITLLPLYNEKEFCIQTQQIIN